ncbi:MAG: hypothetical protein JWO94_566 [Verrucomicrobiaceae bacterium]|nr:hypothetical protein [Verrucomicrobiaceae bacterium]
MHASYFLSVALFILAFSSASAAEGWSLKAPGKAVKVTGKLLDPLNVSGAASVKEGAFIIACDELRHGVQGAHMDLGAGEITVTGLEFPLLEGNKKELDLESAAADPGHHRYYTCGSCGVKRKSGETAPDRQWLFRMETDPKTGALMPGKVTKVSLKDAMNADAFLHEHMDKSSADLGLDVEGLAFKDGRLWFGLRSPNVNGWGFVVAASADDLMAGKPVVFQRFELPLGEDLGIRDMAAVADGFLLVTGPAGGEEGTKAAPAPTPTAAVQEETETVARAVPAQETVAKAVPAAKIEVNKPAAAAPSASKNEAYALYFWAGDTNKPVRIGGLPRPNQGKGKPEGLLVVSETRENLGVIVFSDGAENGAPMLYDVSRPLRQEGPVLRNSK